MANKNTNLPKSRALRKNQTDAECLLWSLLRAKQLNGLKFRRQHPIGPFIVDFACNRHKLIVEIDGDYHDYVPEEDASREEVLKGFGWQILRFNNEDILEDPENIALAITNHLELDFDYRSRKNAGSGIRAVRKKNIHDRPPKPK